eukprot:6436455-Ditylum_brightwellii.AAC.1
MAWGHPIRTMTRRFCRPGSFLDVGRYPTSPQPVVRTGIKPVPVTHRTSLASIIYFYSRRSAARAVHVK